MQRMCENPDVMVMNNQDMTVIILLLGFSLNIQNNNNCVWKTKSSLAIKIKAASFRNTVFHDDVIKWKVFRVSGPLFGEFTGHRSISRTKASDAELWWFVWSGLNRPLSKQLWDWWFEKPSHSLWRHCNVAISYTLCLFHWPVLAWFQFANANMNENNMMHVFVWFCQCFLS